MWILHFLPDGFLSFVINSILVLGLVSTVLSFFVINRILRMFPGMASYYRIAQAVSIAVLTLGVYLKGGYNTEMQWRERVTELEEKLKVAQDESKKANAVVETKVVTKTKVVKEKADTIIQYVDREIVKYDNACPIPKEVIDVHNEAAQMNKVIEEQRKGAKK